MNAELRGICAEVVMSYIINLRLQGFQGIQFCLTCSVLRISQFRNSEEDIDNNLEKHGKNIQYWPEV
jgi:hypothetical protein